MAVISSAITPYAVPTRPAVAGVLVPTPQGTTLVPPPSPPATRRAALAHTPRLSVSHVPALMKHTLPSALSILPLSPVRGVGRMTRCTSTGRSFPPSSRGSAPPPSGALAPPLPEDREFILSPHPVFLLLTPLARQTDQVLRLEAYGMWWRGSRWWFFSYIWLAHFNVFAHPFPVFAQCPPTLGSLQLCWVLHPSAASHRLPCYCTIYRSGQR